MKKYVISGYQPEKLFNYFEDISAVPMGHFCCTVGTVIGNIDDIRIIRYL